MTDHGQMADPSDMFFVHEVFRDAMRDGPVMIDRANSSGDSATVDVVARYLDAVLVFVHAHHGSEDALLWERMIQRLPAHERQVIEVAHQHDDLHGLLPAARAALAHWREDPTVETGVRARAALEDLAPALLHHLDEEERVVVPLIAQVITATEWAELPPHSIADMPGESYDIGIGLLRDAMTQDWRDAMLDHMPVAAREDWVKRAEPAYRAFMAQLRTSVSV